MRAKTANVIDFLTVPHKTSASLYEVLAKEAADAYLKGQVAPNESIAKLASARGLNAEQVHRVVELTNHQINATMSKEATDQLFTFPVASVEGVFTSMNQGSSTKKTAEFDKTAGLDFGVYHQIDTIPNYADVIASRRFNQKLASMPKTASAPEPAAIPAVSQRLAAENTQKKASADFEYAQLQLREKIARLRNEFGKLASDTDKEEFLLASCVVVGTGATQKLAEAFGAGDIFGELEVEGLEKAAEYLDNDHPLVQSLGEFRQIMAGYVAAKENLDKTAGLLGSLTNAGRMALHLGGKVKDKVAPAARNFVQRGKPGETARAIFRPRGNEGSIGRKLLLAGGIGLAAKASGATDFKSGAKFGAKLAFPVPKTIALARKAKGIFSNSIAEASPR